MSSAYADGDTLVDMLGPREIAVGEAMRGGATGSTAIGLNPAGLPLNHELVFEGGFGYRLSDSASLVGVSACDSTVPAPGCFYYSYAGANPDITGVEMHRRTHMAGTSFGYPISPRFSIGSSLKYFNFSDDAMPTAKASGFNWDIGTTARVADMVSIGAALYNIWGADSPEFPRAIGGGILARPLPTLAVSFDTRWRLEGDDKTARYGGGAELFLRNANGQTGFPLRIGGLHDNGMKSTYLSGGLGVSTLKFSIDVAARYAVSGTDETTLIASMRFYGPRMTGRGNDQNE
jgi:hypothetical protein